MSDKKVVLVTGASSGIGKATAELLAKKGYVVIGGARRLDKMQDLVKAGGQAIELDVTDDKSCKTAVDEIIKRHGKIDALINNAGFAVYGSVEDVTLEDAREQFETNVFGLSRVIQLVLPQMRKQKSGHIINVASVLGRTYIPLGAWYVASKHAVEGLTDCLRIDVDRFGIKVSMIEPGGVATEFGSVLADPLIERSKGGAYEEAAKGFAEGVKQMYGPQSQLTKPGTVAETILAALESSNPEARYLVGEDAKHMIEARKNLGDAGFDNMMLGKK